MSSDAFNQQSLEHAWKYFELHSQQRLLMFNFFVAFSTLALAALGATVPGGSRLNFAGLLVGAIIPVVTFVFWHLDRRTTFLVKHGEQAIVALELLLLPPEARIFGLEPSVSNTLRSQKKGWWIRQRSYRQGFEMIFAIVACLGLIGTGYNGFQLFSERWPLCKCDAQLQPSPGKPISSVKPRAE